MSTLIIGLILLSLYFEGRPFSFHLFDARIRISQVLMIIALLYFVLRLLFSKIKVKITLVDITILVYIGINFFAINMALFQARSIKIAMLLLSLYLTYFILTNFITTSIKYEKSFNMLLWIGFIEIMYGLYQVIAGVINVIFDTNMPIGYMGMVHADYIGAFWGRPYGTLQEPDVYGAICMFYLLVFIALYYSKILKNKRFYFWGMAVSLIGLFVSFVRAAWLGFFAGLIVLLCLKYKSGILKLNYHTVGKNIITFILLILLCLCVNSIRTVLFNRIISPGDTISRFDTNNIRLIAMKNAINAFLRSPIIGNGPGSSATNSIIESGQEFDPENVDEGAYNGNIFLTVLEDTGLLGFFFFILLVAIIIIYNLNMIPKLHGNYNLIAIGTFSGLFGLMISYMFSQFFWLTFTWVFIAFNILSIKFGVENGQ